jgi:hypothetical protein
MNESGNVGIGTTAPGVNLEVVGGSALVSGVAPSVTQLRLTRNGTTSVKWPATADLALGSYASGISAQTQLDIKLGNGNIGTPDVTVMSLLGSGNVGIGTTAPGNVLEVRGDTSNFYSITTPVTAATARQITIGEATNNSAYRLSLGFFNNGGNYQGVIQSTNASIGSALQLNPSGGYVGIGNTAPAYKLDVTGDINSSTCVRSGGTTVGGTCTSDVRLKENIQDYNQGLKELLGLRLRTYQFNGLGEMPKTGETVVGVVAQEVEQTNPDLVKTRMVKMHPEDQEQTEIKVVNYSKFTYMLINSVKELYSKFMGHDQVIATQARQIASVDAKTAKLEAENAELKAKDASKAKEIAELKARLDRIEKSLRSK